MIAVAVALSATSPKALWYLTRGTGVVTLILLTISVALGVAHVRRAQSPTVPRFVVDAVHRNASLLAVAFLAVHIGTAVLDAFAPIRLIDVFVPFTSAYRPVWLGLGAVASDLLIAVAVTSVLRRRLGYRAWRATHWAAYVCWPIALVHGLGTGSDTKSEWMLTLIAFCVIVVVAAVVVRAADGSPLQSRPHHLGARATAIAVAALVPLGLVFWLRSGPLAADWAKRAGTPSSLLRPGTLVSSAGAVAGAGSQVAFTSQVSGMLREGQLDGGLHQVHLVLNVNGQRLNTLGIRMIGEPVEGDGVDMTTSRVQLGTTADPKMYRGRVTSLDGPNIGALVGNPSGAELELLVRLEIDQQNNKVSGTLLVEPARGP